MGCTQSSVRAPTDTGKPKPRVFSLIRAAHEVIRGTQRDMRALVEMNDYGALYELWLKLKKWMEMHETMEEGDGEKGAPRGVFRLLDDVCGGAVDEAHLRELHDALHKKEAALEDAFESKKMENIRTAFEEYEKQNLEHLIKEEDVMLPKVHHMTKEGHDLTKYMKEDILPLVVDSRDFKFFVQFANVMLEKHGSPQLSARVFDHALWTAASAEQWIVWDGWIREVLQPETYHDVVDLISA